MKLTKLVSFEYKTKEDKKRAEETFELFKSIEGAEVKEVIGVVYPTAKVPTWAKRPIVAVLKDWPARKRRKR